MTEVDLQKVANLAMPDSNTGSLGDTVHTFRMRVDALPLLSSSSLHHQFLFGFSHFSLRQDPSVPRGFVQKSVVVITDLPFVSLFKRVMRLLGPIHMQAGPEVLEAAYLNMNAWALPKPGTTLELPLLGSVLQFLVPWTGLQSFTPVLSHANKKRTTAGVGGGSRSGDVALSAPSSSSADGAALSSVFSPVIVDGADTASASVDKASNPTSSVGGSIEDELCSSPGSGDDTASGSPVPSPPSPDSGPDEVKSTRLVVSCPSTPTLAPSLRPSLPRPTPPPSLSVGPSTAQGTSASEPSSAPSSPRRLAPLPPPLPPSLDDVMAEKHSVELPGMFQDLGLFTIFRGLSHSLWHLWELAITGQPIVVVGTHPELVGDAVLAIISLISPLVFGGDYRPFFSLYDPDFKEIALLHDRTKKGGGSFPSFVLGTTNPFFIKSLEYWPNAVWLTTHSGAVETSPSVAATTGAKSPVIQADKIKPKVIADGVSLCTVLPTPGHEAAAKMCFISRAEALVPPDPVVLSQLLSIKPKDEQDPQQLRLAPDHSVSFGGTNCGLVPAVIINNALLRQHFRQLTLQFLKPFNSYFHVDVSVVTTRLRERSIGLYDDFMLAFLPKFNIEEFLARVKSSGPPKLLAKAKYKQLYKSFVQSCHFWPWFKAKEQHAFRKLLGLFRAARLSTSKEAFLSVSALYSLSPIGATSPTASPTRPSDAASSGMSTPPRLVTTALSSALSMSPSLPKRAVPPSSPDGRAKQPGPVRSILAKLTGQSSSPKAMDVVGSVFSPVYNDVELYKDLQAKIRGAFTREEGALASDPELRAVMASHLEAVEEELRRLASSRK